MHIVYALEEAPSTYSKAIFLAGPSPRTDWVDNWRDEALSVLGDEGYDGVVYVPLPRDGQWAKNYDDQVDWERKNLDRADCLLFWVPRDMQVLPGLTTNIEWGVWHDSGRVVLGYPADAPHMRYLAVNARDEKTPVAHTLKETVKNALKVVGKGAPRSGGERDVPLNVWVQPPFQSWYMAQMNAGNRLDGARVVWNFRVGQFKDKMVLFAVHANVYIASEERNKVNEVVIFRSDISAIIGFKKGPAEGSLLDSKVILVREFRSPARTLDGMIHEVPGGSSWKVGEAPEEIASHEFSEETGVTIEASRFRPVGSRQLAGTLSAHKGHVYKVALSAEEIAELEALAASGTYNGVEEDTERTYVEVKTVQQILDEGLVDWSTLGMIFAGLLK